MEQNTTYDEQGIICVLPQEITDSQWAFYHVFAWWIEGIAMLLIGCIGIFFNFLTITVLLVGELAGNFFNWLLVALAVCDSLLLLNGNLETFRNYLGTTEFHKYMFVFVLYPFRSICLCISIYITIMLALERYNALVKPMVTHHRRDLRSKNHTLKDHISLHWTRLLKYTGPIIVLSTLFFTPKWLELEIENHEVCSGNKTKSCSYEYEIIVTHLRSNNYYNLWYINIANLVVTAAVPFISLAYLNLNIYFEFKQYIDRQSLSKAATSSITVNQLQKKFRKREKDLVQQTMILFSIVVLFVLFHTLRIVLNVEEFLTLEKRKRAKETGCEWLQYWTIIAAPLSHLLLQINSSINFVIYCYFNRSFRYELSSLLNRVVVYFKKDTIQVENTDVKINAIPTKRPQEFATIEDIEVAEQLELTSVSAAVIETGNRKVFYYD